MKRIAVYKRVSTDRQDTHMQEHAVQQWLSEHITDADVLFYEDRGYTGNNQKRPAFRTMMQDISDGKIDMVVTYRLDRLGRNKLEMMDLILNWLKRDLEFVSVSQPIFHLMRDNPFRLTIMTAFIEMADAERAQTIERIKVGMAAAKARGVKIGAAPKVTESSRTQVRILRDQGRTYRAIASELKMSLSTVHEILT